MALQRENVALTQARMREMLDYNSDTGIFTWKVNRQGGRGIKPGARAGSVKPTNAGKRYRYIRIDGVDYLAKRLAWYWVNNEWPTYLRCLDSNEDNCSIINLADVGCVYGPGSGKGEDRAEQRRRYRAKYPNKIRDNALRATFGISLEDYDRMHTTQDGKCAICGKQETIIRNSKLRLLAVDHCHSSNKVRGLLCGNCNPMIGYAKDSVEVLGKAIEYLNSYKGAA